MSEKQWNDITNIDEENPTFNHELNMEIKRLCQKCQDNNIPIFIAYYLQKKGYKYRAIFPEEINNNELVSEYGKFKKFLKVCIDFNKEDYLTKIN